MRRNIISVDPARRRSGGLDMQATTWIAATAVAVALVGAAPAARADEGTAEERLRRVEDVLRTQTAELERLRREVDGYRRERAPAGPSREEIEAAVGSYLAATGAAGSPVQPSTPATASGLRWGGYFHWRFEDDSAESSFFDQHRLVLTADAAISNCIDFAMEVEIEHGGVSDEIEGEVVLERGELRFHLTDALTAKVGWLLVPFGRYNSAHDDPWNDLTDRPFTARYLVPTGFGQPGLGVEGSAPFGCGHLLSYDVVLTNGYRDAFDAEEGVRGGRQAEDANDGKQAWGRLAVAWDTRGAFDRVETGVAGTYGIYDARNDAAIRGYALDLLVRRGPFEVKAEYVGYAYERGADAAPDAVERQSGAWVEAAYHFFPCPWRGCRSCLVTDTSLFTLVARWQTMDLDDHVRGATFEDDLDAFTLGLNYRITERTVLRVDHSWLDAQDEDDRTLWTVSVSTFF
jgi:hypothetical protein